MSLSEFDMIAKYFRTATPRRGDTVLSIGDDTALIRLQQDQELSTCLLQWIAGVDYDPAAPAMQTGRALLAKAIRELQRRQVEPAWMTLSLSLPSLDETWLAGFTQGLAGLAAQHSIELIGGDSTRGPETLRLHLMGAVAIQMA